MAPVSIEKLLKHRRWVRGLARGLVRGESRIDDLEQETWLRAMRRPPEARGVRAWLRRVVRNLAIDQNRRDRARARREEHREPARPVAPPDLLEQAELQRLVAELVVGLDEPYRSVVLLRFFEGLKPRAIAARLGLPVETVRTRLKRALGKMRRRMEEQGPRDWRAGLFALAAVPGLAGSATATGVLVMTTKKISGIAALLMLLLAGGLAWMQWREADRPDQAGRSVRGGGSGARAAPVREIPPGPGAARWRIAIRVEVAKTNAPVEGAQVRAEVHRGTTSSEGPPLRTDELVTGADGRVVWELAPFAETVTLSLRVERAGMRRGKQDQIVFSGERPKRAKLALRPYSLVLFGKVTDGQGKPIAGARVWTVDESPVARSDQRGEYLLKTVRLGTSAYLHVLADGYAARRTLARIGAERERVRVDVVLRPEFRILGRVNDRQGGPVEGVVVRTFYSSYLTRTLTDADGRYDLGHLDPGRTFHSVFTQKRGWVQATRQVRTKGAVGHADLVLSRGTIVQGRILDPEGEPVARARVNIGPVNAFDPRRTYSGSDGTFTIAAIEPGERLLQVRCDGFAPYRETLQVPKGAGQVVEVRLAAGAGLSGTVRGPDGAALAAISVSARVGRDYLRQRARTDGQGRFTLRGLPAATLTLEFYGRNFVRREVGGVETGGNDLVVVLEPAGMLGGRVVDRRSGRPIESFTIRITGASIKGRGLGYSTLWADEGVRFEGADGYWSCDDEEFPVGADIGVEARAPGYAPASIGLKTTVKPDRDGSLIRLTRGAVLGGRVLGPDGDPVAGATAKLLRQGRPGWQVTHDTVLQRTGADGRFSFKNVAPGIYSLFVDHHRHPSALRDNIVVRSSGNPVELTIAFTSPGRITGVVADAAGRPRPALEISLSGQRGLLQRKSKTDAQGRFRFDGVGSGHYSLAWFFKVSEQMSVTGFSRAFRFEAPGPLELRVAPSGTARIAGRVAGGVPPGGTVSLTGLDAGLPSRGMRVDANNRFVFEAVKAGRYSVNYGHYRAKRFFWQEVAVTAGERREIELAPAPPKKK